MKNRNRNMIESFNNAINGIVYAVRTQKNMKIHCLAAIIILLLSLFYDLPRVEIIALFLTITLVIFAELVNTSIEEVVNIIVDEFHPRAKIVKDVAAGAVLATAFNAVIVAYLIFFDKVEPTATSIMNKLSNSPIHIVFIGLLVTLICILVLKAYFRTGTPLQGGMPSGHSALAFSILTAIWILTNDIKIFTMALVLSLLVVQSRIEARIHSLLEVIIGAFVGVLIMLLLFQLVNNLSLLPFLK